MNDVITRNRRLAILRFLSDAPDYSLNASVMQGALKAIGHSVSRDRLESDFAWLAEQELASVQSLDIPVKVIKISQRGLEVASGVITHPGVDRPAPKL